MNIFNTFCLIIGLVVALVSLFDLDHLLRIHLGLTGVSDPAWYNGRIILITCVLCIWGYLFRRESNIRHKQDITKIRRSHQKAIRTGKGKLDEAKLTAQRALRGQFEIMSDRLHKVSHQIRDGHYELREIAPQCKPVNLDAVKAQAEKISQTVVDLVADLFSECLEEKIACCIKIRQSFEETTEESVSEAEDPNMITYCRSRNSDPRRKLHGTHSVKKNTAFLKILYQKHDYYGKTNLVAEEVAGNYENTTKSWESFYKSAIVVPIRLCTSKQTEGEKRKFTLRGFLCVDALSTTAFSEDMLDCYAHLLMAVGDGLYHYFRLVYECEQRYRVDSGPCQGSQEE